MTMIVNAESSAKILNADRLVKVLSREVLECPLPTLRVTFLANDLPDHIFFAYTRVEVFYFKLRASQCFNWGTPAHIHQFFKRPSFVMPELCW